VKHLDDKSSIQMALANIGDAPTLAANSQNPSYVTSAVCWSYGKTVANTAPVSEKVFASFRSEEGHDVLLPCDFVRAGKYRHGAQRSWCRTHQCYWGTITDYARYKTDNVMRCALHAEKMHYVISPLTIDLDDYSEIGIWCWIPTALSTHTITPHHASIHVYARHHTNNVIIDEDFQVVSILYNPDVDLFGNGIYLPVTITPPSALAFVAAMESTQNTGASLDCVNCARCGYPHLDLGLFASQPHKKHYCGNCGYDSTHSKEKIISMPLKVLYEQFSKKTPSEIVERTLNLDEYSDCTFNVWASSPAIFWTISRPQEFGIRVQIFRDNHCIVDDTFGCVIYQGNTLDRNQLLMIEN
jgi:hypothetical protein